MIATTEGMGANMMTQQGAWGLAGLGREPKMVGGHVRETRQQRLIPMQQR